jgi:hypothetical protein
MTNKVFLCYRRDDSAPYAGRIEDRLARELGRDVVFIDVDNIPLGMNFVGVLQEEVAKCEVLLALIGPKWLDARDESGTRRRLDDPNDFVRIEIGTALQRNIPVIPILLDGARIPKPDQLPKVLEELALRNGLNVRHDSFHNDLDRLIPALEKHLERSESAKSGPLNRAEVGRFRQPASRLALAGGIGGLLALYFVGFAIEPLRGYPAWTPTSDILVLAHINWGLIGALAGGLIPRFGILNAMTIALIAKYLTSLAAVSFIGSIGVYSMTERLTNALIVTVCFGIITSASILLFQWVSVRK